MRVILGLCAVSLIALIVLLRSAMNADFRYGEFTGAPRVSVLELVEKPGDFRGRIIAVQGEVRQQCQAMGCHFFFIAGDRPPLRIDLEKLTGSAPMKEGHFARVEGRMVPFGDGYQLAATAVEIE